MASPLPPLAVAVPLGMAAALLILGRVSGKRWLMDSLALGAAVAATLIDLTMLRQSWQGTLVYWFGGWTPRQGIALGVNFAVDPAGAGMAALAGGLTCLALLYAWQYFEAKGSFFHTLMLVFLAAMTGFCLTGDLFNQFVFFEMMGVAAYALTGYKVEDTGPLEGGFHFAVVNSIGGLLVLTGIALLYARTGALNMAQAGRALAAVPADLTVMLALGLLLAGFFVKAALTPFHFWLPDAHGVAITPASILFSGIMVELGLFAAFRVYRTVFSPALAHGPGIDQALLAIGGLTALVGAVMCLAQRHIKRLLAYSTVSHVGLLAMAMSLPDAQALGGAFLYLAGHGLVKGSLFVCAGILLHRRRSVDMVQLWRRCRGLPFTGGLFAVGGLALAGLPPFGAFAGKALMEEAASRLGLPWLTALFFVVAATTGAAVLRAVAGMFWGWGAPDPLSVAAPTRGEGESGEVSEEQGRTPAAMWASGALLLLFGLALGLIPGLGQMAVAAASRFLDAPAYWNAVLAAAPLAEAKAATGHPALGTVFLGLGQAALAAFLAGLALVAHRLPARAGELARTLLGPVMTLLRRAHSGHASDYVTFVLAGTAALTAVLAFLA